MPREPPLLSNWVRILPSVSLNPSWIEIDFLALTHDQLEHYDEFVKQEEDKMEKLLLLGNFDRDDETTNI